MISVIIPTHKRAGLLFYELERIYRQKNVDIEVVVVNDVEEDDETDKITELFPKVVYIKSSKIQGPSEKHKKGFSITNGEYVYMPDDDDYLIDDHFFEKAVRLFEQDKSLSIVSGNVNYRYEDENNERIKVEKQILNISGFINGLEYLQEFQHGYRKPASTISTIFRRSSLDLNMIEMSDSSIYMEALFNGNAYIIDDIVACYRVRFIKGSSLTSSASLSFIYNVLNQKENFYYRGKNKLKRPRDFWSHNFISTYNLFIQKPNNKIDNLKVLLWGTSHLHGSLNLMFFLLKRFVRAFLLI